MKNTITLFITLSLAPVAFAAEATAPQWQEVELTFTAARDTTNPYTDTAIWAFLNSLKPRCQSDRW